MKHGPSQHAAALPTVSEAREAAAVSAQGNWLRAMLHRSFRTFQPGVVSYGNGLPALDC